MDLIKHAYLSSDEFVKWVLSAGDFFPGFYRFTMGDRNEEKGQLTIPGLLDAYFSGAEYTREEWTRFCKARHKALDPRNLARSDSAVYELIDQGYLEWMTEATTYDILVMEIDNGATELERDVTYFFMGSLLRFADTELLVGYDDLRGTATITLPIDFDEIKEYVERIHGNHLSDFFLPASVVASLTFDGTGRGKLHMNDESVAHVATAHSNSLLIASNHDVSCSLPIRWAKDILLSEVVE